MNRTLRSIRCKCGTVRCEAVGDPIVVAACYCSDCQAGGRRLEGLVGGSPILDPDGGTPYLTYRKDRFRCVAGRDLLTGHKLHERAPTRRFVTSCCNTAMFLEFLPGFWIPAYRQRFAGSLPPIEMRNKTRRRQSELPLPTDAPSHRNFPIRLFWRLIKARAAMILRQ